MSDDPNPYPQEASSATPPSINPYAPARHVSPEVHVPSDVESFRRAHLNHEASVKSVGFLYWLGAIFMVPMGLVMMVNPSIGSGAEDPDSEIPVMFGGVAYLALGIGQGFIGLGIRRLRPWARIAGIVISAIGLIGFPFGTLISVYFLYLFLSRKGVTVFSPSYQAVIEQTPHIKYKVSKIVWVLLGILLFIIALGVVGALLGSMART